MLALFAQILVTYRLQPELPVALRRAHVWKIKTLAHELHGVRANAAKEPGCIRHAKEFIADHLIEPLTVELIAGHVHLPAAQFSRCWNQATGLTMPQYVSRLRVEWGKTLLRETKSKIVDVSLDCGFQSTPAFYRWFRKLTGKTPKEYRRGRASWKSIKTGGCVPPVAVPRRLGRKARRPAC